jgi:hypothetical protein
VYLGPGFRPGGSAGSVGARARLERSPENADGRRPQAAPSRTGSGPSDQSSSLLELLELFELEFELELLELFELELLELLELEFELELLELLELEFELELLFELEFEFELLRRSPRSSSRRS